MPSRPLPRRVEPGVEPVPVIDDLERELIAGR
jgi:hypothetical protein